MDINSRSIKQPSHRHIITRILLTMDFCDDFDIICVKMWEKCVLYRGILSIMKEHIYTIKTLQPDILPESDYLPVYASFQSYPTFLGKKTPQKQALATLKNSKTQASSSGDQNTQRHTHRGLHPLYAITKANTFSVYAVQRYE